MYIDIVEELQRIFVVGETAKFACSISMVMCQLVLLPLWILLRCDLPRNIKGDRYFHSFWIHIRQVQSPLLI